ncbi:MAG: peptidylprolyl isomerase [Bacteroidetes bacterium]|nr:peptidylprolyl isomerase [Bacteroidota bacterium]
MKLLLFVTLSLLTAFGQSACAQTAKSWDIPVITVSSGGKEQGKIVLWLYEETVLHRENFLKLAKEGFYNGTTFHRVIRDFMVQGGDPNSKNDDPNDDGQGGPGYTIQAEFLPKYTHVRGALAAARQGDQMNPQRRSSGSQFYIVQGRQTPEADLAAMEPRVQQQLFSFWIQNTYLQKPENKWVMEFDWQGLNQSNPDSAMALQQKIIADAERKYAEAGNQTFTYSPEARKVFAEQGGTPHLDGQYTVFGHVLEGMNVVDWISQQPTEVPDRPINNIEIKMEVIKMTADELAKKYPAFFSSKP